MQINRRKVRNGVSCFLNYLKFRYLGVEMGYHFRGLGKIVLKLDPKYKRVVIGDNFIIIGGGFRNSISRNMMSCIHVQAGAELCIGNDVRYALAILTNNLLIGRQDDNLTIEFFEELTQDLSSMFLIDSRKRCVYDVRHIDFVELRKCLI